QKLDNSPFYMTGEVYNYSLYSGQQFDMGENQMVNFYANGFESLINFAFKGDANKPVEELFSFYSEVLNNGDLKGYSILNYISSHDDGEPFDKERQRVLEAGTKLLLTPGASQIYYGDETARPLVIEGTNGDANLRSFMNWDELSNNVERNGYNISDVQQHWSKLGKFRKNHIAVGAGVHEKIADAPYTFKRTFSGQGHNDKVVVAMDFDGTNVTVSVSGVFEDGTELTEYYTGQKLTVEGGQVAVNNAGPLVLLGKS
ncbi:MAG: alpha-amylase, partial [Bacteroidota bacterium]